MTNASHKH